MAEARALLEQAVGRRHAIRSRIAPGGLAFSEVYLLAGHLEEANAPPARPGAGSDPPGAGERGVDPPAPRRDRRASRTAGGRVGHRVHYRQALALADELGMRPLQAHCHYGRGNLAAKMGHAAQARAALSTAIDLYRAMDMTFWLAPAEATLARVKGQCS